ncbi:hypothetical protein COT97_03565 [Candidatus Falkowbacteria bacterium CG10_big_fil_rev_8_21_14_0_10_39_11]|uniref:Uncharacterized protein n=1 Tax=Candidatus Falkowbacteria bacterium CG10_big_fil_rev_8_21_14_0_10_39_11 TaxID=1974565 RepID=A0A2H0V4J7_9BACT|nr:MAG: hypothetical protein COT97_03565 [Candidatus Falkowbacteria bacterium CG10_big_fil_rev_8_21_14_0_10_39_11]
MTDDRILKVLDEYEVFLRRKEIEPLKAPKCNFPRSKKSTLAHCYDMIQRVRQLLKIDRDEALIRFGFLQGVLWELRIKTIDQLCQDNGLTVKPC